MPESPSMSPSVSPSASPSRSPSSSPSRSPSASPSSSPSKSPSASPSVSPSPDPELIGDGLFPVVRGSALFGLTISGDGTVGDITGEGLFGVVGDGDFPAITGDAIFAWSSSIIGSGTVAHLGQVEGAGVLSTVLTITGDGTIAVITADGDLQLAATLTGDGTIPAITQLPVAPGISGGGITTTITRSGRFTSYILRYERT